jgi:hypothetical protein
MTADIKQQRDRDQDAAVADTFPASDPPSGTGERGARAVPPQDLMRSDRAPASGDTVTLRRRFPDTESAKLALEGLVRDAPIDRDCAGLQPEDGGVELHIAAPRADADRIRGLLDRA